MHRVSSETEKWTAGRHKSAELHVRCNRSTSIFGARNHRSPEQVRAAGLAKYMLITVNAALLPITPTARTPTLRTRDLLESSLLATSTLVLVVAL